MSINDTVKVIFAHRTIRRFKHGKISSSHKEIFEKAAQRAASSCSGQMYTFVEVSDPTLRHRLYEICGKQGMIRKSMLFYVVIADLTRLDALVAKAEGQCQLGPVSGAIIAACDASFAAQNMVLAAESLGYGTCYVGTCGDRCAEVSALLNLPARTIPLYGLAIGIPAETPPSVPD